MKSIKAVLLFVSLLMTTIVSSQTGLNFQGVARNESGVILASQELTLKLSILQGSADGVVEFSEIRKTTTNAQGLFSVVIGDTKSISALGNFNAIDWKLAPKFLKIEMDIAGGENFSTIGTTQLQSAAYAKFAESADATNLNGIVPITKGGTGTTTGVTKTMVGLGNVDNTSDLNKPISTATQTALDLKASSTQLNTKEDAANKSNNVLTDATSDIKYPTVKSVKTYIDNKVLSGVFDATDTTKGKIQLAGALTGTAALPAIANNAIGSDQIKDASVTDAKIVNIAGTKIVGNIDGNASNITGVVSITNGGTGANNANDARANLGLTIGVNVESPLTVTGPITRVNNAIGMPVASSGVNGYLSSTDWTNFNNKINASEKGANNGVASLGADGKIPSVQIPAISFQSANVVANQTAMLALSNAVEGSIAIRLDNSKNYVLSTTPASTLGNWIELATPSSVSSVNGFAGPNVSLTTDNIAEGSTNKYYSIVQARNAIGVTAPLTYDASTGGIALPRASMIQAGYLDYTDWIAFDSKMGTASATATFVPYTGATGPVNLGNYDLTLHGITVGKGKGSKFGNTVFGRMALYPNTTGDNNSAFGSGALAFNSIGSFNAAFGANALTTNTTGGFNAGFGASALNGNTTGGYNTAFGAFSMNANTVGNDNVAFGAYTMISNISGKYNVATGSSALYNNTTGEFNTSIGYYTLSTNKTGSYNTAIGNRANVASDNLTNATAIGSGAIVNASNSIQLGNGSITDVKTAGKLTTGAVTYPNTLGTSGQVLSTTGAGTLTWTSITGVSSETITTTSLSEPFDITVETGMDGSSIDIRTAENLANGLGSLASNTDGIANVAVGIRTLKSNTTGAANTAVGYEVLYSNTEGQNNTGVGTYALRSNTTGKYNTAVGSTALLSNTTGINNTSFGEWSLLNNISGYHNTAHGANTIMKNTTGNSNTGIGFNALFNSISGNRNTAVGEGALFALTNGSNNTTLGYAADVATGNLNNATAIGYYAQVAASNSIQLGNADVTDVKTAGKLTTGAVTYPKTHGTSGQILSTTGAGTLTWTNPTDLSNITGVLSIAKGGTGTSTQNFVDLTADQTIAGTKTFSSGTLALGLSNRGANTSALSFPSTDDPAFISHYTAGNVGRMFFSAGDDATVDYFSFGHGLQNNFTEKLNIYADGRLTAPVDATINGLTIGMGAGSLYGNTALGNSALAAITTGQHNTAIGNTALRFNTTGGANTAIGNEALKSNTTGSLNIAIGSSSLYANTIGDENTVVGTSAMYVNTTGSRNAVMGYNALNSNTTGGDNIAIGKDALYGNVAGSGMVAIGNGALKYANNASLLYMTLNNAIGHYALTGSPSPANNTGSYNNAFGSYALNNNTSGYNNNAIGALSLFMNTTGSSNIAFGANALYNNNTGIANIAIGTNTLYDNTTGTNNTVIGNTAGFGISTGSNNTIIGANVTGLTPNLSNNIIIANGTGAIKAQHDGSNWSLTGNVAIGTASPTASAALEVSSTTKGFLPPKMTTTQRDAIPSPAEGLTIYNTTTKGFEFYNGSNWVPTTHYVGESYGGGIVFYVYDNGQHGLIAATSDQAVNIRWHAGTNTNTIAYADGLGAGKKNTATIIASQGYGDGQTYAARVCNEYSVTSGGVTYGDWYLPSKYELNLLREAKFVVGNFAGFFYWSSTEINQITAWGQYFDINTTQSAGDKVSYDTNRVRAIRSF